MKKIEIQNLIDRYLAAETTPDEERQLALELQREVDLAGVEALPEDWQAVRLMLGELTLGEAVFDELMAARKTASPVVSDGSRASRRILPFWRWTAAAVFVIAAGLGALLYQLKAPSHLTANVSTTDGTHESHQWDMQVPPVGHADTTSRISSLDQSHQPTRTVASANTNRRKRKTVRPSSMPSSAEMPSPPQENRVEELLLAAAEAERQAMDVQYQHLSHDDDPYAAIEAEMRDIRNRGERVEAMVAEITRSN